MIRIILKDFFTISRISDSAFSTIRKYKYSHLESRDNLQDILCKQSNTLIAKYKSIPRNLHLPSQIISKNENINKCFNIPCTSSYKTMFPLLQKEFLNKKILVYDQYFPQGNYLTIYSDLCELIKASQMQYIYTSNGERKISLNMHDETLEDILSVHIRSNLNILNKSIKNFVESQMQMELYEAGSILSWLTPPDPQKVTCTSSIQYLYHRIFDNYTESSIMNSNESYGYWDYHCDKANNFDYDYTVLLYLNSSFENGELVFVEEDHEIILEPKTARLVIFESSLENIHYVRKVTSGNRFLFSIWYSKAYLEHVDVRG